MAENAGKKKKLLVIAIIIAAALLIFLCYPLAVHLVNYPGILEEKNNAADKIKALGGEIYSEKVFLSTEMAYYGGYKILYSTEYVIIFKSDMTTYELYDKIPQTYICPFNELELWGFGNERIKSAKQPDQKDGYYAAYFPCFPTAAEMPAAKIHTFIYADSENREDINNELSFYD